MTEARYPMFIAHKSTILQIAPFRGVWVWSFQNFSSLVHTKYLTQKIFSTTKTLTYRYGHFITDLMKTLNKSIVSCLSTLLLYLQYSLYHTNTSCKCGILWSRGQYTALRHSQDSSVSCPFCGTLGVTFVHMIHVRIRVWECSTSSEKETLKSLFMAKAVVT